MQHQVFSLTTVDGSQLFAQSWSPTNDKPKCAIGIVHGLGEHSSRYEPLARRMVGFGFQVVAYDQRGHGQSRGEMPPFQTLLSDIDRLIDSMQGMLSVPCFLFGQSLGGGLVIQYALKRKPAIAGVIASSPLLRTTIPPPTWKTAIGRTLGKVWPRLQLDTGIDPHDLTHDATAVERYLNDRLVNRRVSASLGISMLDAGKWSMEHASSLSIPLLIMHGTADRITCPNASQEFANKSQPYCQLKLWPNLRHELHFEMEKDIVLNFVVDWIQTQISRIGCP